MGKGADFEREFCKDLSRWWTAGERDDVFWRTAISGGRASVRSRKGLRTAGGCGDVTATDPAGADLLRLLTVELKKGYGKRGTAFDALDNMPRGRATVKPCQWEEFVAQARRDSDLSGAPYWLLVHRRPMRAAMAFAPLELVTRAVGAKDLPTLVPSAVVVLPGGVLVFAMAWEQFKRSVRPEALRRVEAAWRGCWRPTIHVRRVVAG